MLTPIIAWVGLVVLCRFYWTRVGFYTEGTGWVLWPAFAACAVAVLIRRRTEGYVPVPRCTFAYLVLFVLYLLIRLAIDSPSASDFMSYAIEVLFAYAVGMTIRMLAESATAPEAARIAHPALATFMLFNMVSALMCEESALQSDQLDPGGSFVRTDTYQVTGTLTSIIILLTATLLVRIVPGLRSGPRRRWARCGILVLTLLLGTACIRLTALFGSNAGPAFMIPMFVILGAVWVIKFPNRQGHGRAQTAPIAHPRPLDVVRKAVTAMTLIAMVMFTALWAMIHAGFIDVTRHRVFGFQEASLLNSSVLSRAEIFTGNFLTHFEFAPIFGHFFVDRLTTGRGTYVHSLIAILPHLGIVGSALFCGLAVSVWRQLAADWSRAQRRVGDSLFATFAIGAMLWIAIFVTATSFFTTTLLWLPLGLFVPAVQLVRQKQPALVSCEPSRR